MPAPGSNAAPILPLLRRAVAWSCCAAALLSAAIESPNAAPLALGLLAPPDQPDASSVRDGAALAVAQLNKNSVQTRLVLRGRPGQWGTDGDEAVVLAVDDEVSGMITPTDGSVAHQVLQVAGRTRVPVVSLCPDSSVTGAGVPWAVRIVPRTAEEATAIFSGLQHSERGKAARRWAAFVPPDRAGREAARDLSAAARAAGCFLQEPIRIQKDNADWRSELEVVLKNRPDGVFLFTDPWTAGSLARKLRTAGFRGQLAGPARLRSLSFLRAAGGAAEGCLIPALIPDRDNGIEQRQFEEDYMKEFHCSPDFYALMSYDAVVLLSRVLRDPRYTGAYPQFPVVEAGQGASGAFKFDKLGNRLLSLTLLVCHERGFEPRADPHSGAHAPHLADRSQ